MHTPCRKPSSQTVFFVTGFLICLALGTTAWSQQSRPVIQNVDAVGMTVSDMDRSIAFYSKVLSFEKVSDVEVEGDEYEHLEGLFGLRMRVVRMRLGEEAIVLTEYLAPRGRAVPEDSRSNDHWFQHIAIIVSDMDRAYQWLRQNKVQHASSGPQRLPDWNPKAGGIRAFYFKDPDGHPVEILWFPAGKGDPKWHRGGDKLFMGIDHTAIVVSDTDRSLKFYRDLLGFRVVSESENYGTEQEHLNNVFAARLRITSLRAASGPGVEFLEYLAPHDGRPYPPDSRASDLINWQTQLEASDLARVAEQLGAVNTTLVSPGIVAVQDGKLSFRNGLVVRDPDGHALMLEQK
jgi:catechol 2,3-dioxygenase-like lactoylglutathione lyase family enzyme